ncbi:MAG: metal-dependent hydrolase [Candidatus Makana argininalis]
MQYNGHIIFSLSMGILAKKIYITNILGNGDWWHIFPGILLTCLLPDIDHPKSFIGKRIKWLSLPLNKILGHRGFTHSLFIVISFIFFFKINFFLKKVIPVDAFQAMMLGYISHIISDIITPLGVPIFWPFKKRIIIPILGKNKYKEKILCIFIFFIALIF